MSNGSTSTSSTTSPAHVATFNQKVGELLKSTDPSQIADILSHPSSLLSRVASDNVNQNQGRHRAAE